MTHLRWRKLEAFLFRILDDVDIFKCHIENIINSLRENIGAI